MPAQYPFIDVAVHDFIRPRLARGEALVLFAPQMERVLWCNGAGARFFGFSSIYDFLEDGPNRADVTFRQIDTAMRQLAAPGDRRSLTLRSNSGFRSVTLNASVEMLTIRKGEPVMLVSIPSPVYSSAPSMMARDLLTGFDDPDTHMAVLDASGMVVASSASFAGLSLTQQTAAMLVSLVESDNDRLVKRPIPTGRGYLPAAIGKICDDPAFYLLFAVETILGHMDPSDDFASAEAVAAPALAPVENTEPAETTVQAESSIATSVPAEKPGETDAVPDETFDHVLSSISDIEEIEADDLPLAEQAEADDNGSAALDDAALAAPQDDIKLQLTGIDTEQDLPDDPVIDPATDNDEQRGAKDASSEHISPDTALKRAETVTLIKPNISAPTPASVEEPFIFDPTRRATRFVWKIDVDGRFCDVSPEFGQAIGPHAAKINGVAFADLSALFNLDPDGKIADLLKRRDTWSGKTIYWPVEGTSLMVPVDLAALPTYTRNRDFDGFRGFGIVRLADAIEDPAATGLTFVRRAQNLHEDDIQSVSGPQSQAERDAELAEFLAELEADERHPPEDFEDDNFDFLDSDEDGASDAGEYGLKSEHAFFAGDLASPSPAAGPGMPAPSDEPPVLRITPTRPAPEGPEKIVRLTDHRGRQRDGLTPGEQAAFREIARKLDPLTLRARVEQSLTSSTTQPPALRAHELSEKGALLKEQIAALNSEDTGGDPPTSDVSRPVSLDVEADDEAQREIIQAASEALSKNGAARRERSLTAEIVDMMPVALLVHAGEKLIHANPEFFTLTGYSSLDELTQIGGLDALIQREDLNLPGDQAGRMVAVCANDDVVPVTARLQSIRFNDASALMLVLIAQPALPARADGGDEPPSQDETAFPTISENLTPPDTVTPPALNQSHEISRLKIEVDELRSILETATDGVVILDCDGDIRSMNRAASALFNFDDLETRGKPFVMLFAHESQKSILDYLNGLSGHGVASVLNDGREVIGREASGGFLPLFMTIGKLSSSNGYCAVIRDITQWKRTEDELKNAKRAAETANAHKTDFLARVSHEIRTPLNAIIGFADMMANEHFGPVGHPRYGEYAHDIVRSGRHVLDIVNDLLDISKIEAGEMELDFESVGLNEMVQAAVSIIQPQANSQRVIIRTALSQAVPPVVADGRSIKQIVLNILANAVRFTPSGGQIIVSTAYEANGSVALRIRDTGIGMSRSELEQAMKPFRQVSTGTPRSRGDGTGLGLPLTKAMVDANRALFAISSTPNEGTLVEVTFPSPRVLAE